MAKTKELKKSPFMGQKKEASSRQFWKEPSRASGLFLFSALISRHTDTQTEGGWGRRERETNLVGDVEEGQVALGLAGVRHHLPLLLGGVHTRGVVSAAVQHDDGAVGRRLDVLHHPVKVQPHRLLVKVPVLLPLHAGVAEDVLVVAPVVC